MTWAGMSWLGGETWLRRGEVFTQVFGIFGRFAPVAVRAHALELRAPRKRPDRRAGLAIDGGAGHRPARYRHLRRPARDPAVGAHRCRHPGSTGRLVPVDSARPARGPGAAPGADAGSAAVRSFVRGGPFPGVPVDGGAST